MILAQLVETRLYEVAFNWDYYGVYPKKILAVWEGGLCIRRGSIVGPLVGVGLAPVLAGACRILRGLDVTARRRGKLRQVIGRWETSSSEEAF